MSVLIVEDDDDTAMATTALLAASSYRVSRVRSVAGALGALSERPHVALVDVNLPDGSGLDVIRRIAAALPGCFIVAVSGESLWQFRDRALAAGAHAAIEKPIRHTELLRIIPPPQAFKIALGPAPPGRTTTETPA